MSHLVFDFRVGQRVKIRGIEGGTGTVRYLRWDGFSRDYFVSWWHDDKRTAEWLSGDELEAA
jgi:hypothetical protein